MTFSEIDENYDPVLFEGIADIDFNDVCLNDCLTDPEQTFEQILSHFPLTLDCESDSMSFSYGVPLNPKEWLIQDSITKRQRSPRLFEFLILLLGKYHYESYASFVDRSKGIFHIHQPEKVAELWQAVKSRQSNQKMTYDKFARAIRWYYKNNLMQKTNTRYTFQFSPQTLKNYFLDENNNSSVNLSA